jgi:hypothetical protein
MALTYHVERRFYAAAAVAAIQRSNHRSSTAHTGLSFRHFVGAVPMYGAAVALDLHRFAQVAATVAAVFVIPGITDPTTIAST